MVKYLYCIRDIKADYFLDVQTYRNDAEAMRIFEFATKNKDSFISQYPSHFELHKVGSIDDESGYITADEKKLICSGIDFVKDGLDEN